MSRSILILGSEQFIAKHLIRKFIAENLQITKYESKDLQGRENLKSIFKNSFNEVYQFAVGSSIDETSIINNNVLQHVKCKRFFFASNSDGCIEKEFAESQFVSLLQNTKVYIGRFQDIIGEDSASNLIQFINKVSTVKDGDNIDFAWGEETDLRSFMYIDDAIDTIYKIMKTEETNKEFVIGSKIKVSFDEIVNMIKKISGKKFTVNRIASKVSKNFNVSDYVVEKFTLESYVAILYYALSPLAPLQQPLTKTVSIGNATSALHGLSSLIEKFPLQFATTTMQTPLLISMKMPEIIVQKSKVLFISQKMGRDGTQSVKCGVGIRGKLTADLLTASIDASTKFEFISCYIDNDTELETAIVTHQPKVVIYNFHQDTTKWLMNQTIRKKFKTIKHVMIHYDVTQHMIDNYTPESNYGFEYVATDNQFLKLNKYFKLVTRSIPNIWPIKEHLLSFVPTIGFQGFAVNGKGMHKIAFYVQNEFDEAIIRLHCPQPYYTQHNVLADRLAEMRSIIKKPGITFEISTDFKTDTEIISWLSQNTINCYFYDENNKGGLASSTVYALAAKRPIAITRTTMMRDMWDLSPTIEIERSTLKTIISNGFSPLVPLYEKYSHTNFIQSYENIVNIDDNTLPNISNIPKIVDCFLFFNELDLLKIRLEEISDEVDYFVLVEANTTFTRKPKPLFYDTNKHLFKKYNHKIIHIIADTNIIEGSAWDREYFQRNSISRGIEQLLNNKQITYSDIMIISDVDEIPDSNLLKSIKLETADFDIAVLEQDMYYYNLTCQYCGKWYASRTIKIGILFKDNMTANVIRTMKRDNLKVFTNAGWHLSYFGDVDFIKNKIKSFSHTELDIDEYTNSEKIRDRMIRGVDLFNNENRGTRYINVSIESNTYLPNTFKKICEIFPPLSPINSRTQEYLNFASHSHKLVNFKMSLNVDLYKYTQLWFLNSNIQIELMKHFSPFQKNTILEIGSHEGISACCFSDNLLYHTNSTLDCVDSFSTSDTTSPVTNQTETFFMHNIAKTANANKCKLHKMYSDEFFTRNTKKYNFIYIDGSHVPEQVQKDLLNAMNCIQLNGIIWMDDYGSCDAFKTTVDDIYKTQKHKFEIIYIEWQFAMRKIND